MVCSRFSGQNNSEEEEEDEEEEEEEDTGSVTRLDHAFHTDSRTDKLTQKRDAKAFEASEA